MIQWWQILLLTLYSAYQICDELTIVSSAGSPVFAGFITGLVMGDLKTGLFIGASLQLTVLGVGTFGGASRIDATSGAVLATAFSVAQGIDAELAIATIAVPVATLLTYFDILGRMTTTYFAHRVDAAIERYDYKGIERNYLLGAIPWALSRALPVFFALAFGGAFVETVVTGLANVQWLANGLKLAGQMLPGLGFAILLRYLPVRRNLHYLALGFGLTAMLTVLGVGTFGGASRIDATSGAVLATAFSVAKGIDPEIAIATIAVPVATLLTYFDILGRMTTTYFAHRVDAAIERYDYKGIERNYLLGAVPWALSRALPVFFALAFGGSFVETVVTGLANVQWLANGLKLAGQMLPGLGFAILLRYLPVRRNLHYLALGFGLTAMLTVLYSNVQSLGAAVSSIVGSDVFAKLPKEQAITFVNNFKSVSMIGIAIIGIFLAVQHFKNSQRTVVAAPASNVESGEIEDDEF